MFMIKKQEKNFIKDNENEGLQSHIFDKHNKLLICLQHIQANTSQVHFMGILHIIFLII